MACLLRRRSCCVGPCQGLGTWRVAGSTQAREFGGVNDGTQSVGGAASQPLRTPPPRREARVHHLATTLCGGGAQLSTSCGSRLIRLIARCYLRRARRRPARLARMPPPRRPRISPPRLGAAGRRPRLACGGAPARPSPASRVRVRVRDRVRGRARARVRVRVRVRVRTRLLGDLDLEEGLDRGAADRALVGLHAQHLQHEG